METSLTTGERLKHNFFNYSIASRLSKEVDTEYQTSVFLATIGQDVFDIYDGLEFDNEEDKMDLEIVMKKLEDFFAGETHEAFESYKFHHWKQEPTESIDAYVAELCQLAKNCNFGRIRDELIRDQVVVGVRDDSIREKLQAVKQLTLKKCLQIGRVYETSKQQTKIISSSTDTDVKLNRVNKRLNKRYPSKNKSEKNMPTMRKISCP